MKKNVLIINQNKGGVGKSFLTSLLVKKHINSTDTLFIDIDSGNRSSYKRFTGIQEVKPKIREYTLLESENIDKGKFDELFQIISKSDEKNIVLDLGGNESRELISLIELISPEYFQETFNDLNLIVKFITVIRIGDIDTFDYLNRINNSLRNAIPLEVLINGDSYSNDDDINYKKAIELLDKLGLNFSTFGKGPAGVMREKISDHVKKGFQSELGLFKGLFKRMVEELNIDEYEPTI